MSELPSGTVTFLFTDIEGSTRLVKQLRDGYAGVVAEHRKLLRAALAEHRGSEVDSQGDSFFVVFRRAKDAIDAAASAQRALAAYSWPEGVVVRVRMGIHTGQAEAADGRYHGLAVHRTARIMAAAHGGQVLISQTTRELLEDEEESSESALRDLGEQRLKDLDRPVRLHQLELPGLPGEFPPLRTLSSGPDGGMHIEGRRGRRPSWRFFASVALVAAGAVVSVVTLSNRGASSSAQTSPVAADSIGVFNAGSGKLIAQAPVRAGPSAVAFGAGSLWVANLNDDSASRVDPKTIASTQTIAVGNGPSGIAVGGGFVWVANSLDGSVSKIDPNQNNGTVVDTLAVGARPSGIAFGAGALWVANAGDRTVVRIDPSSATVSRPIAVEAGADRIAVGDGAVWVTSEASGVVSRIDPRSAVVIKKISVSSGVSAIAVTAGSLWVANGQDGTVSRIDTRSNEVKATVSVGGNPNGIAATGSDLWVSDESSGSLVQIDATHASVRKEQKSGNRPTAVTLANGVLYVAVRTSSAAHVGGTLRLVEGPNPNPEQAELDPAFGYGDWQLQIMTNDGLVTYRRAGIGTGAQLVPDLALSLPTITDHGRTYTFQLRQGIHYSTGAAVRPADFRHAIERALRVNHDSTPGAYFAGIVGADKCSRARCDLSHGIEADAASNTVTFHLTTPDPEFLYKLTLPTADAVPGRTPLNARLPLPATGPYMVARYDQKRGIQLVRNTHFHEWSAAAQPSGYPDRIAMSWGFTNEAQARAIERGTADLAPLPNTTPQALVSRLKMTFASRVHENPELATGATVLNTRVAPFNDIRVRQAVNYAVDRNRWVDLKGGAAQPSCQLLPPNIAGYGRYCPYTIARRADGKYTGPDLARARALVAASGTKGQSIAVRVATGAYNQTALNYLLTVLRSLGYQARLDVVDYSVYSQSGDSRRRVQAMGYIWAADYPLASTFVSPLLTCASFKPRTGSNSNWAEFCDKRIDRTIAQALARQPNDPQGSSALWRKVDRELVDQSPWVTVFNPQALEFVSRRVSNYVYYPMVSGALLDQLWVR